MERPLHLQPLDCMQDLGGSLSRVLLRVFGPIEIPAFIYVDEVSQAEVVDVAEIPRRSTLDESHHLRCNVVAERLNSHGGPSRLEWLIEIAVAGGDLKGENLLLAVSQFEAFRFSPRPLSKDEPVAVGNSLERCGDEVAGGCCRSSGPPGIEIERLPVLGVV